MKLKSWTHFFQAIKRGDKTHDLRSKKDREFHIGQILTLQEYDPWTGEYTGDEVDVQVTYVTDDVTPCAFSSAVLDKGYCILSIRLFRLANRILPSKEDMERVFGEIAQAEKEATVVDGNLPYLGTRAIP